MAANKLLHSRCSQVVFLMQLSVQRWAVRKAIPSSLLPACTFPCALWSAFCSRRNSL